MQFDSNRAWQEAAAAASASRSILLPVAGVFFLIPAVASSLFLGETQAMMMANLGNQDVLDRIIEADMGKIVGISLIAFVVQLVGYLAVLTLLTDRSRPTVGEAIGRSAGSLPTVIGASLIGYVIMMVAVMLVAIVGAILSAALGAAGAVLMVAGILVAMTFVAVKLSLTLPVVVVEGERNPFSALSRSWRLTHGNTGRLLGFYLLLFIGYLVIAVIAMVFVGAIAGVAGGAASKGALILTGVVSGAIGAVVAVLLCAVLAAVHRQLSGRFDSDVSDTFA